MGNAVLLLMFRLQLLPTTTTTITTTRSGTRNSDLINVRLIPMLCPTVVSANRNVTETVCLKADDARRKKKKTNRRTRFHMDRLGAQQ